MNTFTFPYRRGPVGFVVSMVLAVVAMACAGLSCELLQPVVYQLPVFQHMDGLTFLSAFEMFSYVMTLGSAALVLWLFADWRGNSFFTSIGLSFSDLRQRWLRLGLTSLCCYIGVVVLTYGLYSIISLPEPQSPAGDEAKLLSGTALMLFAFTACILAPIVEETLFRGLIQNTLRAVFRGKSERFLFVRDLVAVVLASAIFAGAHGTLTGFPPLFIAGLMMGVAYWRTGSLWASMGVHLLNNVVATLVLMHS
jgi:membrane protease YdiL (CAAX protease family)